VLTCATCLRELERARLETLAFRQSLEQGGFHRCARCGQAVPVGDIRAGGIVHYQGQLACRDCSRDVLSLIAAQRRSDQAAAPAPGTPGAVPCAACRAPVTPADVASGRALRRAAEVYCAACATAVRPVVEASANAAQALTQLACARCDVAVAPRRRAAGPAAAAVAAGSAAQPGHRAVRVTSALRQVQTPCAGCRRVVPTLDLRLGRAGEVLGRLYCARCKQAQDAAAERRERRRRRARTLPCSSCERQVTPAQVKEGRVLYHHGNLFCTACAADPGRVADSPDLVEEVYRSSIALSVELTAFALSYPCDGCDGSIQQADLEAGSARSFGEETLCPNCTAARVAEDEAQAQACPACGAPGVGGIPCTSCQAADQVDERQSVSYFELSQTGVPLACVTCQARVTPAELATRRARVVEGKLLCPLHAPAALRAARRTTRRPGGLGAAGGRDCPTCDGPIAAGAVAFAGRRLCAGCRPTLERLLARCKLPAGVTPACKLCQKPASAPEGLLVDGEPYCGGCRRAGELLIQLQIRATRGGRRRSRSRPRAMVLALGLLAVAASAGLTLLASALLEARGQAAAATPIAAMARPADAALQRVRRQLSGRRPSTLEEADAILQVVEAAREAVEAEPDLRAEYARLLAKASEWRRKRGTGQANALLAKARAVASAEGPAPAAALLADFPADLETTGAGQRLATLRERLLAEARCREAADAALARPAGDRAAAVQAVLDSPDAERCELSRTPLGRELAAALRRDQRPRRARAAAGRTRAARAQAAELLKAGKAREAEAVFTRLIATDPTDGEAHLGAARAALLLERTDAFERALTRALLLRPREPEAQVLDAWRAYLLDRRPRAAAQERLSRVAEGRRGVLGARLEALLRLGAPSFTSPRVRLHTASDRADEALFRVADATARRAARALGGGQRGPIVLCLGTDLSRPLAQALKLDPRGSDGAFQGTYAIAPRGVDAASVRRAVAAAAARRSVGAPGWLLAALPEGLAAGRRLAAPRIDPRKLPARPRAPKLVAAARAYASLANDDAGAAALGAYVRDHRRDPQRAAAALRKAFTRLRAD
jgi:hypothetical protein